MGDMFHRFKTLNVTVSPPIHLQMCTCYLLLLHACIQTTVSPSLCHYSELFLPRFLQFFLGSFPLLFLSVFGWFRCSFMGAVTLLVKKMKWDVIWSNTCCICLREWSLLTLHHLSLKSHHFLTTFHPMFQVSGFFSVCNKYQHKK